MTKRSLSQKIGAVGHRWLMSHIEDNPNWLARELGEDYGIDIEAELTEHGIRGDILKIQIKSTNNIERRPGFVRSIIDRKYVDYATSCRYPVVLVVVDAVAKEAWYLWLQDWILKHRSDEGAFDPKQGSWVHWIPERQSVANGLQSEWKSIARWEGESQLVLSLMDALKSAAAIQNRSMVEALSNIIDEGAPAFGDAALNALIDEAIRLGNRMHGDPKGNAVADQLFALVRRVGGRISQSTVRNLVLRGESYSRVGLSALAILYDEFFDHIKTLKLPELFLALEPRVAFYCAFREAFPAEQSANVFVDPTGFTFAGLAYIQPEMFWDKYANRGPSALLDYLVIADPSTSEEAGDASSKRFGTET